MSKSLQRRTKVQQPSIRLVGGMERPDFHVPSDAERGIVEVVYKCSSCGDVDTERLFTGYSTPDSLNCVKCGAGFGGRPGGMFPVVGDESPVN